MTTPDGSLPVRAATPYETRRYVTGIALLLVVVFLWTLSNFVTQSLFSNGYHKPFLITYFNTSAFAFYLIPLALKRCTVIPNYLKYKGYRPLPENDDSVVIHENIARDPDVPPRESLDSLSTKETARLALTFCFLWFVANWTVNASLDYVSVASATILSSTSGFVTLGLGRLFGVESLTATKATTVVTSFIGVVLVCLADNAQNVASSPGRRPILGDFLAVLSAVFYALYVLLLKIRIKEESRINMQLFFGFVGIFNIVLMIPIAGLLHISGFERFGLPQTAKEWGAVALNMFITWSSDYIYVLAMLKTTPVVVTIGLSLTIPLAVIGDTLINVSASGQAIVGACLVLFSFVILGLNSAKSRSPNNALPP